MMNFLKSNLFLILALLLGAILLFKSRASFKKKQLQKELEKGQKEKQPGGIANYSKREFAAMADKAHAAMKGWGTDDDALGTVMASLKNDKDAQELETAYGIRSGESLGAWIENDGEGKMINDIFVANGITYTFTIIE